MRGAVAGAIRPDIVVRGLEKLTDRDLRFLVENFPQPVESYAEIAKVLTSFPTTLESMLDADYVYRKIFESRSELLAISPFLLFNVLLRRNDGGERTPVDRAVINYLANVLSLFVRADRVQKLEADDSRRYEYFVDLAAEAQRADERRRFLLHAHIGNYALYLTGFFPEWLEYRRCYKRRPIEPGYYADLGRAAYRDAGFHSLARNYELKDVFLRLALLFNHYRRRLNVLARDYLYRGGYGDGIENFGSAPKPEL